MANETGLGRVFLDSLDFLYIDCWSGDPDRALACRMNTALGVMASLILPVFLLAGFFGNSMTAYIYLWRLRPLTRHGVYYAAIAISDNGSLFFSGFMWMLLAKGLPWISGARVGYFTVNASDMACRIFRYLESIFSLLASSLILTMVVDRCLSVYFPFRFQRVRARTAIKACSILAVTTCLVTVPFAVPIGWIRVNEYTVCATDLPGWRQAVFTAFSLALYLPPTLPFFAILAADVLLIRKMRQVASEQAAIRAGGRGDAKLKNTIICVALSTVLVVCGLPTVVYSIGDVALKAADINVTLAMQRALWGSSDIGKILFLIHQSVNCAVLFATSAQFRGAFLSTFCSRNPSETDVGRVFTIGTVETRL